MLYIGFNVRTQAPHEGLFLEAAWVSIIPHIISHVRCVLKVARFSEIEVRLTLFVLVVVGVHNSVGGNVVALL